MEATRDPKHLCKVSYVVVMWHKIGEAVFAGAVVLPTEEQAVKAVEKARKDKSVAAAMWLRADPSAQLQSAIPSQCIATKC